MRSRVAGCHGGDTSRRGTRAPEDPTDLGGKGWLAALKRTVKEFKRDNLTDWAAALTYYGILAIFPALIALVSLLGLIGDSATQPLIDNLGEVAPGAAKDIFTDAIRNLDQVVSPDPQSRNRTKLGC